MKPQIVLRKNAKRRNEASETIGDAFRKYFDAEFYLAQIPRGLRVGDPLMHFYREGWKQGLDPSIKFSTTDYLSQYPDVRADGMNPLEHFVRFGLKEGRLPKRQKVASREAATLEPKQRAASRGWDYDANINIYDRALLEKSAVFDVDYYRSAHSDLSSMSRDELVDHYLYRGGQERRSPSPFFDPTYYFEQVPGLVGTDANPLLHYLRHGERQGLRAVPWFWSDWYNRTYKPEGGPVSVLDHYIQIGSKSFLNPNPFFDARFYLQTNPDLADKGIDPWLHYLSSGHAEHRNPSPLFDQDFYTNSAQAAHRENPLQTFLLDQNYLRNRASEYLPPTAADLYSEFQRYAHKSDDYESLDASIMGSRHRRSKPIAFYLPQFHAIPQNDEAWGKGFTEWRNTSKAMPRFQGHFQPRIPEELGHYNLADHSVFGRQIDLARAAGIFGFCFYYYWFNGSRALEKPIDSYLDHPEYDFPFAIMWANENWTRRWDGLDDEVIFRQDYREDDERALLADLNRHFSDPRYIRVGDRPLFILYRPNLIPDCVETIARWREILKKDHQVEPYILMVQGFGDHDPAQFGLDGAVEFPPHHIGQGLQPINNDLDFLDIDFRGNVIAYDQLVERSARVEKPSFPLIRGIIPSWDNEARRGRTCTVYHGSTPAKYEEWLRRISNYAQQHPFHGEPFVFINAWNEWAEAAYLEPDVHYGAAYLNATSRALTHSKRRSNKLRILVVGHDAHPHGAQINALHMVEQLVGRHGCEVSVLLLKGGSLAVRYSQIAHTIIGDEHGFDLEEAIAGLAAENYHLAITNTVITGAAITLLKKHAFRIISLVHELPRLIADYGLETEANAIAAYSDHVIFAADEVRDGFREVVSEIDETRIIVRPQGCYYRWKESPKLTAAIRKELGLAKSDSLVLNVGYADGRKGFDIFAAVAKLLCHRRRDIHFAWLGNLSPEVRNWIADDIKKDEALSKQFHFLDFTDEVGPVYEAADLFFLSSREDPYPTVMLEALQAGLPIVGFAGSGGGQKLIQKYGALVDRSDLDGTATTIEEMLDLPRRQKQLAAQTRKDEILHNYDFGEYVEYLLHLAEPDIRGVDVVVPNYKYAEYLEDRLDTIFEQTYPLSKVIVLDDKSPDDSLDVLENYGQERKRKFSIVVNEANSGSGYLQWAKGARLTSGDYVWIAEADDLADPEFIDRAVDVLENSDAAFVFSDSRQIDEKDELLAESYSYYYSDLADIDFSRSFVMDGKQFVTRSLAIKNVIMNVSGVVWRRDVLLKVLDLAENDLSTMKVACDWKMYATAALGFGSVGFVGSSLNTHRRHSSSVTHSRNPEAHYAEIVAVQDWIASRIELPDDVLIHRSAYRDEVRTYLGLT